MSITFMFQCDSCRAELQVETRFAGKRVKCTKCGQLINIPAAGAATSRPEEVQQPPVVQPIVAPAPAAGGAPKEVGAIEREFAYKPKWWGIVIVGGLGALIAIGFAYLALGNNQGAVIKGIALGALAATVVFWAICVFGLALVALVGTIAYGRLTIRKRLAFAPNGLIVPSSGRGLWGRLLGHDLALVAREEQIAYQDMALSTETNKHGLDFMYIDHPGGRFSINAAWLPSEAAFQEMCELLAVRVVEAGGSASETAARPAMAQPPTSQRGFRMPPSGHAFVVFLLQLVGVFIGFFVGVYAGDKMGGVYGWSYGVLSLIASQALAAWLGGKIPVRCKRCGSRRKFSGWLLSNYYYSCDTCGDCVSVEYRP